MKRWYYNFLIIALLSFALQSCESWFDISPKSDLKAEDLFSNEQGFRDALIGSYALMTKTGLYGAQLSFTYLDVLAQYYATASGTLNTFRYAYTYDHTNATEESRINSIWSDLYNVVANLNGLLDRIDDNKSLFSTGNYELIKGEALALRAYIHLDLLRLFAPAPSSSDGLNGTAIPYVDTFTNQLFTRLTTGDVLDRIVADLTEARTLLAEVDPYGPKHSSYDLDNLTGLFAGRSYRMNYYAATALLARALLYEGTSSAMDSAYVYATEVINSGLFPLISSDDISGVEANGFTQENIFAIEHQGLKDDVIDKYFYVPTSSSQILVINSTTLSKIFPTTISSDYRRQWWIEVSGSYYVISKYNYSERIPLLKVPEMYLIAAETAPDIKTAASWFNTLQYHRGLPDEELTASNLQEKIRKEYAKEFVGEGQLFYTYKRMNVGKTPILEASINSPQAVYVLPIPKENTDFAN
jgi:hypothetical protein